MVKLARASWRLMGCVRILMLTIPLVTVVIMGEATAANVSRDALSDKLEIMLKDLAGRELTAKEVGQVTNEFLGLFGEDGNCAAACAKILAYNKERTDLIRTNPHSPQAILQRHLFAQYSHFSPPQRGTLIARLIDEGDPILAVDRKTQRLLTRSDIVALIRLNFWANGSSPPKDRPVGEARIGEVAAAINQMVGSGENDMKLIMPPMWNFAGGFWAGLKEEWPKLNKQDRTALRNFVRNPIQEEISASLYQRLLDLSEPDAKELAQVYKYKAFSARSHQTLMRYLGVARKKGLLDAIHQGYRGN